ncbi:MAG: NAD(P)H-binding protein [Lacisediminihabitans sp.]
MSYVVTATTGHLGRLIVESLLARGVASQSIVATARNAAKLTDIGGAGVRTAVLDYTKPETVTAAIEPGDVLVLVSGSELGQRVEQHSAVITAAKDAGVARIVYTSAPAATTSDLVLAPEHKATEEFLVASGVPFTILRNGWYSENYLGEIDKARESGEIVASVGSGTVASASRADYAEAAAAAMLDDSLAGQTIELTGDHAWSFDELASTIGTLLGRDVAFRNLTAEEHLEMLKGFGLDDGTAGFVVALDGNIRDGLLGGTEGELSRLIGHPTTPLAETLAAAL